jgi:Peptidase family M1 domain
VLARSVAVVALLAVTAAGGINPRSGPSTPLGVHPSASRTAAGQQSERSPAQPTVSPPPAATRPRIASYSIDARLDPRTRRITGREVLTWRNATAHAAPTLRFHLYYNAWRNTSSSWVRERRLGGDLTVAARPEDDWSWIDIERLTVNRTGASALDLSDRIKFIAPDDGNADDRTVAEVALDQPVNPGETLSIQIAWSSRVPRTFARTGAIGNYFFIAQWFPKIGVLEDTGWNCHQFHSATEFFSDFGAYDVRLTVPRGWVVGATGVVQGTTPGSDGTTTHRYVQEDVHDFAWTTSPDYLERTETFTHPTLPAVAMRLLLQPEHEGQERRHFDATGATLKYYGEWFGAYPYGHITVIDPAWQSAAGGMEYPTLFTAGTHWLAPRDVAEPEGVTIHEAGHQFWYGLVANNEFEDAWMDEGINTFSTSRALAQVFTPNYTVKRYFGGFVPWVFRDLPLSRDTESRALAPFRPAARSDAQSTPTWQYWPGTHAAITYNKTVLWLHTLERMVGWDTLQRILSTYFSRWSFRHPKPEDFFAVVNEVSGHDLTWFFDQIYRSSNVFDYGVDVLRSEPTRVHGYTGEGSAKTFSSAPPLPEGSETTGPYRTTVVVRRFGEAVFPVDVRVVLENDEEIRWRWDGRERWKQFEVVKPARARRADVDPDHVLLLDVNTTNNSALLKPAGPRAARKWSLVWLIWLQDHLLTYGFFV